MTYVSSIRSRAWPVPSTFVTWFLLGTILLIPSSVLFYVAGESGKFTPGRLAIALLFIPAVVKMLSGGRRFVLSDLFIALTGFWMVASRFEDDGLHPSAVAETIEMFGGYVVARAYFFGEEAIQTFMRIFKICMIVVIVIAIPEPLAGQDLATTLTSSLGFSTQLVEQFRFGVARAASTIEDAELFGTLCCIATILCLYLVPGQKKWFWVGFCFFGVMLALSSGPLLGFIFIAGCYAYDRVLKDFPWRWKLFGATLALFIVALYSVTNNPVGWLISHLVFDIENAYFRLFVFERIEDLIAVYPWKGWGFSPMGVDEFIQKVSVDNVWLVVAVRFGLPTMVFLLLTNITTFYPGGKGKGRDAYLDQAGTAFTFALVAIMFIGLTVHYWNAIWMLWAVLLGIRASIKEAEKVPVSDRLDRNNSTARSNRNVQAP